MECAKNLGWTKLVPVNEKLNKLSQFNDADIRMMTLLIFDCQLTRSLVFNHHRLPSQYDKFRLIVAHISLILIQFKYTHSAIEFLALLHEYWMERRKKTK